MTGFAKTVPNHTRTEIHLLLNIKATLLYYVPRNTKQMAIDGQVYFQTWLFATPVKPLRCTTGSVELVNGINADVNGARLLPTTVSTYSILWIGLFLSLTEDTVLLSVSHNEYC